MKKMMFLVGFFLAFCQLSAQEATSTWPYLYNDFQNATVFFKDGSKAEYKVNVHLLNSKLHYLDGENVKETKSSDLLVINIGAETFYSKQGLIMKAVASNEMGFVGEVAVVDMAALNSSGGAAYGASANSVAIRKLSSIDGAGPTVSTNHMNMKNDKENGVLLQIEKEYYLVTKGDVLPAKRKNLEILLPMDKRAGFKGFLKQNKIQWKSPESLIKIINYINE